VRELVEKTILEKYASPAVVLDEQADILYFHGNTGRYLTLPRGEPNFNIFNMVAGELHFRLSQTIEKVRHQKEPLQLEKIQARHNDSFLFLDLFFPRLHPKAIKRAGSCLNSRSERRASLPHRKLSPEKIRMTPISTFW
jgi:hypothetical protein